MAKRAPKTIGERESDREIIDTIKNFQQHFKHISSMVLYMMLIYNRIMQVEQWMFQEQQLTNKFNYS